MFKIRISPEDQKVKESLTYKSEQMKLMDLEIKIDREKDLCIKGVLVDSYNEQVKKLNDFIRQNGSKNVLCLVCKEKILSGEYVINSNLRKCE